MALGWLCTPESMPSICLVYGFAVALGGFARPSARLSGSGVHTLSQFCNFWRNCVPPESVRAGRKKGGVPAPRLRRPCRTVGSRLPGQRQPNPSFCIRAMVSSKSQTSTVPSGVPKANSLPFGLKRGQAAPA